MKKSLFSTLAAFMIVLLTSTLSQAAATIVCIPNSNAINEQSDQKLGCYYHFGYTTNDSPQMRCYVITSGVDLMSAMQTGLTTANSQATVIGKTTAGRSYYYYGGGVAGQPQVLKMPTIPAGKRMTELGTALGGSPVKVVPSTNQTYTDAAKAMLRNLCQ